MSKKEIFHRNIDLNSLIKSKSFFLMGPRSTGKSYWIKKTQSGDVVYIDLLKGLYRNVLLLNPEKLEEIIDAEGKKKCIIDEIQKVPDLLNEVHRLIEDRGFIFLLTGSSARKLKKEHANLLGGRAGMVHFFPLSFSEIEHFDLEKYLLIGGIPRIYQSDAPFEDLYNYISVYLEQEIQMEANVRNLQPFQRFLKTAAFYSGEMIQYSNVSRDSAVPITTVKEYFQILVDTLVGFILEPWIESKKRKAIQTAKFYLFDPGVQNAILDVTKIDRHSDRWGKLFEGFILSELRTYNSYHKKNKKIFYWRSVNKQEVDFIVGNEVAIEVKSSTKISDHHLTGLKALQEEEKIKTFYLVSNDPIARKAQNIHIIHWEKFLKLLWSGKIF